MTLEEKIHQIHTFTLRRLDFIFGLHSHYCCDLMYMVAGRLVAISTGHHLCHFALYCAMVCDGLPNDDNV